MTDTPMIIDSREYLDYAVEEMANYENCRPGGTPQTAQVYALIAIAASLAELVERGRPS